RAGAVGAMRGAHDLVVLPALAVAVLPASVLVRDDAVPLGEGIVDAVEEGETVEEVAHVWFLRSSAGDAAEAVSIMGRSCPAARARPSLSHRQEVRSEAGT